MCVSVVFDYADTVAMWLLTTWTRCERSQRLHGHVVSVVKDYVSNDFADTDQTMQTLSENFKGSHR